MNEPIPCAACNGEYGHWTQLCDNHLDHYIRYLGLTLETKP